MRVLCLHGRGSNNEIFQLQTASIRADLDEFNFEFVQGTILHTEGNWSLYTTSFSSLPLYAYYNPLDPSSILQTEDELIQIIADEGPFDGVLGYSGGAALAAQIIIRDIVNDPLKSPNERPFRFAVFINGASPLRVFRVGDVELEEGGEEVDTRDLVEEAQSMFFRPSALRAKPGVQDEDQPDHASMLALLQSLKGGRLKDGTPFVTDGKFGLTRWNQLHSEILIDIPTLHILSPGGDDRNHGLNLMDMCSPDLMTEYHHDYGHDFPRGRKEMKKIAQLIREMTERL